MLRNPVDVSSRVSPELSEFLSGWAENPDNEMPRTLGNARDRLAALVSGDGGNAQPFGAGPSLLGELEALIGEFGEEASAVDFIGQEAGESLSRVIAAVLDGAENPPTLGSVREEMAGGLAARLIGEGSLEEDEDETLFEEIDALIDRHGADALAENFLRYD